MWRAQLSLMAVLGLLACPNRDPDQATTVADAAAPVVSSVPPPASKPKPPPVTPPPTNRGDPPRHAATKEEVAAALEKLSTLVKPGATDVTNPWAMAHGLLAFGPEMRASDGRRAVDAIVQDHLDRQPIDGRRIRFFHPRTSAGVPVEPHPFMMVKAMLEADVPLDRKMRSKDGRVTLAELIDDLKWMFVLPKTDREWHQVGWSLSVLAATADKDDKVVTRKGAIARAKIADAALARLEREQGFLLRLMRQNRPDQLQKRRQGIFAHSCGGMHFVQGAIRMAGLEKRLHPRIQTQLELTRFRWAGERQVYSRVMNARPRYRPVLLVQQLKFFGHLLETMALATRWGLLEATDDVKAEMHLVAGDLIATIQAVEPFYGGLVELKTTTPQVYHDLIGDGCHAIRGMRESLVAFY